MKHFAIILVLWNIFTFMMMGIDKRSAIKGRWRISEKMLLSSSFIMGAGGISAGAIIFHHKTKKLKFKILIPVSIVSNIAVIYILMLY